MQSSQRLTIHVTGRVQGVFFRKAARARALKCRLVGYAENLSSGRVKIVAEGSQKHLQKFLDWCYHGSRLAKVQSLHFEWDVSTGEFGDFSIIREGNYFRDKIVALENLSHHLLKSEGLPRHIAIIPDGNRRWARERKFEVAKGHEHGIRNITDLMEEVYRLKIPYFTAWGFSTENWKRSKPEVNFLMDIFRRELPEFKKRFIEKGVQFCHFGRRDRLPDDIVKELHGLEEATNSFDEFHFGLALDYGGRDEIMRTVRKLSDSGLPCSEENFSRFLDTTQFPDPDLIIRTSGEQRLSGLMPWQGAYAELHFSPLLFPDFGTEALLSALSEFASRGRRYGG